MNRYTTVIAQSAKPLIGDGIQIVVVAHGPDLPDVADGTYTTSGPFDLLSLRLHAIALLARLNAALELREAVAAIIGLPIDLPPPPPPAGDTGQRL